MSNVPQLRFREFGGEWEEKKLGDITNIIDSLHQTPKTYTDIGFPMIRVTDVNGESLKIEECLKVSNKVFTEFTKKYEPKKHDIILSRVGTCGASIQLATDDKVCLGQNTVLLHSKINKSFFHILIKSNIVQNQVTKKVVGSTQKTLSLKDLKKFLLLIPTKIEQEKIASFLSAVDTKIEQLSRKAKLLEEYKKGVMQKIFSQELRYKDEDGSEYPEWVEKKLGEISECLDNLRKPLNDTERQKIKGDIPYWGANNIMGYVNDYLYDETIILLAEDGGNFNDFKTRPIANISYGKCWVNNHTHVLRCIENISQNEFLFYSLVHKNITGYVSGGTRTKLIKSEMLKIKINLPSLKEQTKIATFLSSIDTKLSQTQIQVNATKEFKKALLQQMFV